MERRKVLLDQASYESLKKEVLNCTYLKRVEVKMSELDVEDLSSVTFRGNILTLSNAAVQGLVGALGISKKFVETLRKGFKDNTVLINKVVKAIRGDKAKNITLIYNTRCNEITNIYPTGTKLITDHQYFDALEKVISRTDGAYLRNLTQDINGDLKAVIANPKLEFQFNNKADECFTSGMTLNLTAHQMKTSFFTERLICSNGMVTNNKLCTREVNKGDKVPEFLSGILDGKYHLDSVKAFQQRLNRCYHTRASLKEVLSTEARVNSLLGKFAPVLTRKMSVNRLKLQFGDARLLDSFNHCFINTDVSLWDLVNEVTALSSRIEQHRIQTGEGTNLALQIIGGDMMFRRPDLGPSNIKQLFRGPLHKKK